MQETRDLPAWVRELHVLHARGTPPPLTSTPGAAAHGAAAVPEPRPRGSRRLGRFLLLLSIAVIAGASTAAGVLMWRRARKAPVPAPAAVAVAADGRIELSPDRRAIARIGRTGASWSAPLPAPIDSIEVTGSLVLGRTSGGIVGVDLASGASRLAWTLPAGERWGAQAPGELGGCLLAITIRGDDALARCLDLARGEPRWTAKIAGGRECARPPVAVPGAYLVQCPGWTTVIDERNGAVSFDAGGIGLVQREPPLLLRGGPRPVLAPWSAANRRFSSRGTAVRGIDGASSAVLRGGRVVARAPSSGDKLAIAVAKTGAPVAISAPELQLADDAPLALDCGAGTSPRFQLLELAPRASATFDPETAQHRVLALLDTEAGRLAWTSRRIIPPRRLGAPPAPICRHGHYFVPIELRAGDAASGSALWIVDAESGATAAAFAFAADAEASFAELAPGQIDADRIVGVARGGTYELRWARGAASGVPGSRDARADLERTLGRLP